MPAAEVNVSVGLVRRLLAAQHPDLTGLPAEFMANGWDNAMFRLGDELVVRLPRRQLGARILVHEQQWLPVLAPRLPLPVPVPVRIGRPGEGYPWPWSVVPFLPGRQAAAAPEYDPHQAATAIGGFLGALHIPAPPDAPGNPSRGTWIGERAWSFFENLRLAERRVDRAAVLRVWEDSISAPRWDGAPVWLHGDLHPANILMHEGRVSGVIDFGDVTSGDPATDLAVAWMLLPARCHGAFRDAYRAVGGTLDDALWARAKGWALRLGLVLLTHSADSPWLHEVGRHTVAAVLGYGAGPAVG
jgi:aminoglycoside phosphotransferase (APT) family kinase protein